MGCGTEEQSSESRQYNDNTVKTTFDPASEEEKALLAKYSSLGDSQRQTLDNLLARANGTGSMFALTPEDQAKLDAAYGSGRLQLETGMRDFADFNAGGRGMRMSDTPVAQQALQRYGLGLAELESNKAKAGLDLGFNANMARNELGLNAISASPSGYANAFNPLFTERMRSGSTRTTGYGYGTQQSTYDPSILQQMNQGAQFRQTMHAGTNQATQAGGNAMGMASMFSDVNLKRDIKPFSWKWNGGDEKEYLGVIAQDVERSHPHLVSRSSDGALMVNYGAMTAMLLDERERLYHELGQLREQVAAIAIAG